MTAAVMELFTRRQGKPHSARFAEITEALDGEQLHPPLGKARAKRRQVVERRDGFTADKGRVDGEIAAKREAFHREALARELNDTPVSPAEHEAHEIGLAPLLRESERLARQIAAATAALPIQDEEIQREEKVAAPLIREQFHGLLEPLVARVVALLQAFDDLTWEDSQLRELAAASLAAVNGEAPTDSNLPYILPRGAMTLVNEHALKGWVRELTERGFTVPLGAPRGAGQWQHVNGRTFRRRVEK